MDKILNFPDAMKLASILDKPELSTVDENISIEDFSLLLVDTMSEEELGSLFELLEIDISNLDYKSGTLELMDSIIKNNYFQLMDAYRKMGYK